MNKVADILEAAGTALLIPGAWTRETTARTARGEPTLVTDNAACKFCAMGAIRAAAMDLGVSSYYSMAVNALGRDLYVPYRAATYQTRVTHWNDDIAKNAGEVAQRMFAVAEELRRDSQ